MSSSSSKTPTPTSVKIPTHSSPTTLGGGISNISQQQAQGSAPNQQMPPLEASSSTLTTTPQQSPSRQGHSDDTAPNDDASNNNNTHWGKSFATLIIILGIILGAFILILATLGMSFSVYGLYPSQCAKCQNALYAIFISLSIGAVGALTALIAYLIVSRKLFTICISSKSATSNEDPLLYLAKTKLQKIHACPCSSLGSRIAESLILCTLIVVSVLLFLVFFAIYIAFMVIVDGSMVRKSGSINLSDMVILDTSALKSIPSYLTPNSRIEIKRDENGLMHVTGETEYDMIFGQGYASAQDRLFEMDLVRRAAQGRLSELAGSSTLEDDKLARYIGYGRMAKKELQYLDEKANKTLRAYSDGVNAYLQSGNAMPLEVTLLGYTLEPWTPYDTLTVVKYMESFMSANWHDEELRYSAMSKNNVTLARMEVLDPPIPFNAATVLTKEDLGLNTTLEQDLQLEWKLTRNNTGAFIPKGSTLNRRQRRNRRRNILKSIHFAPSSNFDSFEDDEKDHTSSSSSNSDPNNYLFMFKTLNDLLRRTKRAIGSNNWAVHKNFTDSTSGYLANDPHLFVQTPDQFYLVCMNYVRTFSSSNLQQPKELRGAAFPGVPGIVLGRNEYIAWGITLGYTDVQDIYMLKADSSKEDYYVVDGVSLPFKTFTETIKSSDSAPVTIKIRESIFGTVVGSSETELPAYRWVAQQDNDKSFNYLIHLMFSKNWDEFKTNVNGMTSIVFNFAYLDVYGNIGYKLSGLIPIRREGHTGRYIVRGDTKAWDYSGYLPTNQNPELFNPAKGYVSSANNRVVPPGYPILVSANYFFYYRQERIQELMDELMKNAKTNGAKITLQNMVDIQLDTYSILYREYRFMFVNMTSDVAKFASTSSYASTRKYSQHLQTLLVWDGYVKRTSTEASLFEGFLRYLSILVSKEFGDNSETKKMALFYFYKDAMLRNNDIACLSKNFKSCTEYGAATFIHVVDLFYQQYGKIPEWGDIHTTPIYHISGKDTPILGCLSKISLSTDGGTETILLNNMNENYETIEAPVFREIISFNSVNEDRFIIPTGNDGNLFSKTYENMGTLYAKGQYLSFASNMSQVNAVDTYLIYVK